MLFIRLDDGEFEMILIKAPENFADINKIIQALAAKEYDSGYKWFEIGTKEEFNYRRRQIQELVRRCQIHNRYTRGGKGRKRKCKAINHWHRAECNFIGTKLHTYSHLLVKAAIDNECGTIKLLNQKKREKTAQKNAEKGSTFVLRNWSYFGLKEKIKYKAALFGIKFISDKEKPTKEDEEMESIMLENG